MEKQTPQPVCGQEALVLLNCVTESPFDQEKCLRFMQSLRECVLSKLFNLDFGTLYPGSIKYLESALRTALTQLLKVTKFEIPSQDQANEGAGSATKRPS